MSNGICVATKENGTPCQVQALPGDDRCVWHSADAAAVARRHEMSRNAVQARVRNREKRDGAQLPSLTDLPSAIRALAWCASELAAGRLSPKASAGLVSSISHWMRAQNYSERIAAIEKKYRDLLRETTKRA